MASWWLLRIMFRTPYAVKFGASCVCPKCNRLTACHACRPNKDCNP
jgi:hypothetical protein